MNKTYKLALTAMFCALSVVSNIATIPVTQNNAVSFTVVIAFLAGIYLGALPAAAVGFLGDLIGHLVFPIGGAYNWFVGLSCAITGVIPALVYKLKTNEILKLIISLSVFFAVCSVCLNTFGFWLQYIVGADPSPVGLWQFFTMEKSGIKKSFWVYLLTRLPFTLLNTAINGIIVGILRQTRVLDKLLLKSAIEKNNAR
ncbi:MAG: ECF transporter S component [Firmicutes bacterium]|nr:ECF transporter S component [Bacillota bacterium]